MSSVLGVFASDGAPSDALAAHMLHAMSARGADSSAVWRDERGDALLAVARYSWELEPGFSDDVLVLAEDDVVVAADASIYYRAELRQLLQRERVVPARDTAAHMILAAYRAWREECAERLEGDFAFIVWDRRERRVVAARDFSGKRTLFFAEFGGTMVVASTVGGVLAHTGCPREIDLVAVAESAGGLFGGSDETCYSAVRSLPAGWTLSRSASDRAVWRRHWAPPSEDGGGARMSFDDAAVELRARLERAVAERVPPRGETSIWLSGGWDSPAVFGAGQSVLRARSDSRSLRPVSMSYPPGDPGCEDELIQAVAGHWSTPVHWIDIRDVPFFDRPQERAAQRDDAFGHAFEMWHRALGRGSRAVGAHVALEGAGGDQLFQVSEAYFADLLIGGRWLELRREWKAKGMSGSGFRNFFRLSIQPLLGPWSLRLAAALRGGRPLVAYLERRAPLWLRSEFLAGHGVEERERAAALRRSRSSCVRHETEWYLTYPYFPRVFGLVSAMALEEGVEIRSPLYDRRVIEFALTRPRWERSSGRETKRLLRRAVYGLLPDAILAPRPSKTGTTGGYFDRSMREGFPALCEEMLRSSALAANGMIDAEKLRRSTAMYLRGAAGGQVGVNLFFTLQAEFWLRAHSRPADRLAGEAPAEPLVVTAA